MGIKFRSGYKYQLAEDYRYQIGFFPITKIVTDFIELDKDGWLLIRKGYAWDGPSGPTIDTLDSLRGSLVHDALYQLMRLEYLPQDFRLDADQIAYDIWRESGMNPIRAWLWKRELGKWGAAAAIPKNRKKAQEAP